MGPGIERRHQPIGFAHLRVLFETFRAAGGSLFRVKADKLAAECRSMAWRAVAAPDPMAAL